MKVVLKDKIDVREIGGPGFVQANIIFPKLDEIITHDKFTKNQSTGKMEENVLHIVESGVSSEGYILIILEEEIGSDYCGAIGEA